MVDTLARSDQDNDASIANLSKRRRVWLLTVASVDVLLVITSMVALNAALPDLAVETSRLRANSPGSSTATHWCWRACCCLRAQSATGMGDAAHCSSVWPSSVSPPLRR